MIKQKSLEDIVREKVSLGRLSNTGFYNLRCPVCNDHSERGGFKFDGDTVGYSCFNCGSKFKYEEGSGKLSKNAKDILQAFGITRDELSELTSSIFTAQAAKEDREITLESMTKVDLFTPEVAFPDRTRELLSDGHEELQEPILEYLLDRHIDPTQVRLYFSLDPKMLRRVIIPFWRDGKLIYWQARSIDKDVKPRYLNCVVKKDAVIYGYDHLHASFDKTPLFVTEGVFDAIPINGIAIMGSNLNTAKVEVLKRTRRRLIFVIDRDRTGSQLAEAALAQGWEITFVDIRAKDINDSIIKFGLPFTAYSLMKHATDKTQKVKSSIDLNLGMLEARLRGKK